MRSIARTDAYKRDAVKRSSIAFVSEKSLRVAFWCAAISLVLFLSLPLVSMVWRSAQESRELPEEATSILQQALRLSVVTSSIAMVFIVVSGTPLAYVLARRRFPGAGLVDTL